MTVFLVNLKYQRVIPLTTITNLPKKVVLRFVGCKRGAAVCCLGVLTAVILCCLSLQKTSTFMNISECSYYVYDAWRRMDRMQDKHLNNGS